MGRFGSSLSFAAKELGQRAPLGRLGGNGDLWGPWLFGRNKNSSLSLFFFG
jgi:hypothetical protein